MNSIVNENINFDLVFKKLESESMCGEVNDLSGLEYSHIVYIYNQAKLLENLQEEVISRGRDYYEKLSLNSEQESAVLKRTIV